MAQAQMAHANEVEHFTDMPVGEVLKRTRLHYKQSIKDVEKNLRIRASQIEAIENGEIDKLPGRVYAIGFVRSYAEYLGLDGEQMVNMFKAQSHVMAIKPEYNFPAPATDSKLPAIWLIIVTIALAITVPWGWAQLQKADRSLVDEIPAVPQEVKAEIEENIEKVMETAQGEGIDIPELRQEEMPAEPTSLPDQEVPATEHQQVEATPEAAPAPAAEEQDGIILNILENSWVEIRDKTGKTIVSKVLNEGDQYYVPDRPDLRMSLGNAGGVEIQVNGKLVPPFGERGQVRRDIPLDVKELQNRIQSQEKTSLETSDQ